MDIQTSLDAIKNKLDDETYAKISEDIANIQIFQNSNNEILENNKKEISKLKDDKEALIKANGNLMLKIPRSNNNPFEEDEKQEPKKTFDFRDVFDEKGNFKTKM